MKYRKNVNQIIVVILVLAVCLLSGTKTIVACDCIGPRGKEALEKAKVAFSGKVVNVKYLDNPKQSNPEPRIIVTFDVYRVWKGNPKKTMVLHTVFNGWTCNGYWFKEAEEYLVFAHANSSDVAQMFPGSKDTLGVSTCGGTSRLAEAQEDIKELGSGKVPSGLPVSFSRNSKAVRPAIRRRRALT